jgi:hypothetical protein
MVTYVKRQQTLGELLNARKKVSLAKEELGNGVN